MWSVLSVGSIGSRDKTRAHEKGNPLGLVRITSLHRHACTRTYEYPLATPPLALRFKSSLGFG